MSRLAVLDLHTSDDSSPADASPVPTEPAAIPERKGCGCLPRWLAWTLLLAIGGFALFSGACLDACTGSNHIRHVPAIHGRVVDMETGQPLAGVRITRYFVRNEFGGPGGGDQSIAPGSWYTTRSRADGTFELPGWWGFARGISSIKWGEFKPGWTAAWGNILLKDTPTLDIAKNYPSANGVVADTPPGRSRSTIVLKLHRVDNPMAAADHFWALRVLLDERMVNEDEFVRDAAAYLGGYEVTEEMLYPLAELTDRINPSLRPHLGKERCEILSTISTYCHSNPHSIQCGLPSINLCCRDYQTDCLPSEAE